MSRSSASERSGRPAGPIPGQGCSGRRTGSTTPRGQVEPFAALAAVFALGLTVSLYATVLSDVGPGTQQDGTAETTLSVVHRNVSDGGVVRPGRVQRAPAVAPAGHEINVTLTVAGETWQAGPVPPGSASSASRRVSVRLAPGNVRPGRLTVVTWS